MFSLKAFAIFIFGWLAVLLPASGMPSCGVCSESGAFRALGARSLQAPAALGEKKALYVRLTYADDTEEPITMAAAETLMSQISDWFHQHSYGQFWTKSTVTPLLRLPRAKDYYYPIDEFGQKTWRGFELLEDAREAARKAGFEAADYDFFLLRFNAPFMQSFANLGSPGAWLVSSDVATTIHEMGHNLGLQHANFWNGPINGVGANVEYGDEFDIMGNPLYYRQAGFHAIHKRALGWLKGANIVEVKASGVYRLYAHDVEQVDDARAYALRVRKDDQRDYWIEKRTFDVYEHIEASGVLLYWDDWNYSNLGTHLLDPTPDPGESLRIGTALHDAVAGVRIIPVAHAADRSYADVAVILGNSSLTLLPEMLHFSGRAGREYRFEVSSDLRNWTEFNRQASATGELFVPIDSSSEKAFYRVIEEPERR